MPAYQDNYGTTGLCRTRGHRDNTQLLFGHEEDIATTTKATPVFPLFPLHLLILSFSFSFLVSLFFLCVDRAGCSPRNNNCKLKRTTGIQITLSRRNQLRQKDSTRLDSTRLSMRAKGRRAPGPVPQSLSQRGIAFIDRQNDIRAGAASRP